METMKFYTEEEILDRHIGEKDTPKRDKFEADLDWRSDQTSPAIKESDPRGIRQLDRGTKSTDLPDREWEEPDFFYYFQSFQGYGNKR